MKRTKEEAALTRRAVLDAALVMFNNKGLAKTTLDEIAREAKVTRGAIYWHFKNKVEIFQAILEENIKNAEDQIAPIFQSEMEPLEKIRVLLKEFFLIVSDEKRFRILEEVEMFRYEKRKDLSELYCYHREKITDIQGKIANIVREGIGSGALKPDLDPAVTVLALLSFVSGIKSAFLSGFAIPPIAENTDNLTDIFINGIKNPAST